MSLSRTIIIFYPQDKGLKYGLLILITIILQACTLNKGLDAGKPAAVSHELISGQWIETESFNRLTARDIADPHPFNWLTAHEDILTCFKDGKPFFLEMTTNNGFLERKGDYYHWMNEDSVQIKLQFTATEKDTFLRYEYQFRSNEPFVYSLSKIPWATPCDFDYYPGADLKSGKVKSYHHLYFKGQYEVKEIARDSSFEVEILEDFSVSGFPEVGEYSVYSYGSPLLMTLFEVDTLHKFPIKMEGKEYPRIISKNKQYFTISEQENGFDLHQTDFKGKRGMAERRFKVLEKAYEFRRKQ